MLHKNTKHKNRASHNVDLSKAKFKRPRWMKWTARVITFSLACGVAPYIIYKGGITKRVEPIPVEKIKKPTPSPSKPLQKKHGVK